MVIWLVGLSGSGKTSIGRTVYSMWKKVAPGTVLIDGDEIRGIFGASNEESYTLVGRAANSDRMAALCGWLDRQGINVVCCILSIFEERRVKNREEFSRYFEVFIDVPMETLIARDIKNLYLPAIKGERRNVVGVDIPFPPPSSPDMRVDNSHDVSDHNLSAAKILMAAGVEP